MDKFTLFLQLSQTKPLRKLNKYQLSIQVNYKNCPTTSLLPFFLHTTFTHSPLSKHRAPTYPLPSLLLRHLQSFIITFLTIPSKTSSTPGFLDH